MRTGRPPAQKWTEILTDEFAKENPATPLTDDALGAQYGVDGSTILRYRKQLGIPSAYERRRKYKQESNRGRAKKPE